MQNVNADGLDGVELKVLTHGVRIEGPDHALRLRNHVLLRPGFLLPHETQRLFDAVHRSRSACNIELPVTEFVLGNIANVARLERPAAGSLAVAEHALNGRVRIDRHDARTQEHLIENKVKCGSAKMRGENEDRLPVRWMDQARTDNRCVAYPPTEMPELVYTKNTTQQSFEVEHPSWKGSTSTVCAHHHRFPVYAHTGPAPVLHLAKSLANTV